MMSYFQLRRLTKVRLFLPWAVIVIIAIGAVIVHLFATRPWGVGVTQDTVFYFSTAENFLGGRGISWTGGGGAVKPLIHFPPLYPLTLASVSALLGDINSAATWINAILYGLNVFIISVMIRAGTKSNTAAIVGGGIALFSPLLFEIHLDAMSEPLYLTWVLLSIGFVSAYLKNPKLQLILVAGITASLAVLTRYIGISVVATGIIALLVWHSGSLKQRVLEAARFGIVAAIPVLIWYVRNFVHTGSFTNRSISFHLITLNTVSEGLNALSSWFLPASLSLNLRVGATIVMLLIVGWIVISMALVSRIIKRTNLSFNTRLISLITLHAVLYFLLLIFSISFIDASTRLDNRLLSPVYTLALMLGIMSFAWIISILRLRSLWMKTILGFSIFIIMLAFYMPREWRIINSMRLDGRGFSGKSWRQSEIIAVLRRLDPKAPVYSNEAFSVLYLTGVPARWIPERDDPVKAVVREDFDDQMEKMRDRLTHPNSLLAVFHHGYLKAGMPTLDEIIEGLVIVHESRDGIILVSPENEPSWSFP